MSELTKVGGSYSIELMNRTWFAVHVQVVQYTVQCTVLVWQFEPDSTYICTLSLPIIFCRVLPQYWLRPHTHTVHHLASQRGLARARDGESEDRSPKGAPSPGGQAASEESPPRPRKGPIPPLLTGPFFLCGKGLGGPPSCYRSAPVFTFTWFVQVASAHNDRRTWRLGTLRLTGALSSAWMPCFVTAGK